MIGSGRRRFRGGDEGAYAVLYAALVVVLLAFAAIVVDLSTVRQDRRLNRSAADAAALGGARFLLPNGVVDPFAACNRAWEYLSVTLRLTGVPANKCDSFNLTPAAVATHCAANPTAQINSPDIQIGNRSFRIAWPVPPQSNFLNAEIAPGNIAQPYDTSATRSDGTAAGCDRIGVAVFEDQTFSLAGAFGATGTTTQVHSVALARVQPGGTPQLAALNVLNPTVCQALDTGGQGQVVVNRGIDSSDPSGTTFSPGIIAIESDGTACGSGTSDNVLAVSSNNNNRVCASGQTQVPDAVGTCDGKGLILQAALDPGGRRAYPGSPGTPQAPISPAPQPENGISRWTPVTDIYGCRTLPALTKPANTCQSSTPNYIKTLYDTYGSGTTAPTSVYSGVGTYAGAGYGAFQTLPGPALPQFTCSPSNLYIPAGNWFINCPDDNNRAGFALAGNGSTVVFGGGHVVFAGGIDAAKATSCFAFNVPLSPAPPAGSVTCPIVQGAQTSTATTSPPPVREAILLSRGRQSITNGSSNVTVLMPQTMIVQTGGGALEFGGGTGTVLWTPPAGGSRVNGVSTLGALCSNDRACMTSRFDKISYWNESTAPNSIGGQGSITYVGVYFAPRARFTFAGQGAGAGTNAQFWADTLSLSGLARLFLTPDAAVGVPRPVFSFNLIR